MKRFVTTAVAALALVVPTLAPSAAHASPILECGGLATDGVSNITTRNVSCSDARAFAHKFTLLPHWGSGRVTLSGWHTYWVAFHPFAYNSQGWIKDDVRATRTNHVIHFQIGPFGVSDGSSSSVKCAGIPLGQACY